MYTRNTSDWDKWQYISYTDIPPMKLSFFYNRFFHVYPVFYISFFNCAIIKFSHLSCYLSIHSYSVSILSYRAWILPYCVCILVYHVLILLYCALIHKNNVASTISYFTANINHQFRVLCSEIHDRIHVKVKYILIS